MRFTSAISYAMVQILVAIAFAFSHRPILEDIGVYNDQFSLKGIACNVIFLSAWAYCFTYIQYYRRSSSRRT